MKFVEGSCDDEDSDDENSGNGEASFEINVSSPSRVV